MPLRLSPLPSLEDARPIWTDIGQRQDNVFSTWEWAAAWWPVYGGGRRQMIYAAHDQDGDVRAILPLYIAADHPVRLARFIGHGPADQLGPVCAEGDRALAADALRVLAGQQLRSWGLLLGDRLRADEGWAGALHAHVVSRESFPLVGLDQQDWEGWLASKSHRFRQHFRQAERKLTREHDLRFRLVTAPEERERAFETFLSLHSARWGSRSSAFTSDRRRFYDAFTALAAERGWLRLWFAEVDGQPAAAWLGFRFGRVDSFYQAGRDPRWDRAGIGTILVLHTVREALADGMREYRLLIGDEPYKRRIATTDPGVETLAIGTGPLPMVVEALAAARRQISTMVRARRVTRGQRGIGARPTRGS